MEVGLQEMVHVKPTVVDAQKILDKKGLGGLHEALRIKKEALGIDRPQGKWFTIGDGTQFGTSTGDKKDPYLLTLPEYHDLTHAISIQKLTEKIRSERQKEQEGQTPPHYTQDAYRNLNASEIAEKVATERMLSQEGTFRAHSGMVVYRYQGELIMGPDTDESRAALKDAHFTETHGHKIDDLPLAFNPQLEQPIKENRYATNLRRAQNSDAPAFYDSDPEWWRTNSYWQEKAEKVAAEKEAAKDEASPDDSSTLTAVIKTDSPKSPLDSTRNLPADELKRMTEDPRNFLSEQLVLSKALSTPGIADALLAEFHDPDLLRGISEIIDRRVRFGFREDAGATSDETRVLGNLLFTPEQRNVIVRALELVKERSDPESDMHARVNVTLKDPKSF